LGQFPTDTLEPRHFLLIAHGFAIISGFSSFVNSIKIQTPGLFFYRAYHCEGALAAEVISLATEPIASLALAMTLNKTYLQT
jgi:hypothetical protein